MEANSKVFQEWLNKTTLNNKIPTAKYLSVTDGLFTRLKLMDVMVVKSWLSEKTFYKFSDLNIDVRNTESFNKLIGSFKDKIKIENDNVFIKLSNESKKAFFKRANEIDNYMERDAKIEYDTGFEVNDRFVDEVLVNINNSKADYVEIEIKGNILIVGCIGNEDKIIEECKVNYKDSKFCISAEYFKLIFSCLKNEKVNIALQDLDMCDKNPPIKVTDKKEGYKIEVWCAPYNPE